MASLTFLRFMTQTVFLVVCDFFWGPDKVSYRPCIIIFIAIVLLVIRIQNNIIQQKTVQLYSKFDAHSLSKFRPKQKQIMIWKASFQDSAQKCPRLACSQHQPPSQGSSPCPSALSPGSCTLQSCLGMTSPQRCYHI